jgi:TPR repeat protein
MTAIVCRPGARVVERASRRTTSTFRRRCSVLVGILLAALLAAVTGCADIRYATGHASDLASDYANAVSIWLPLAHGGDPIAQYELGFMYEGGLGVAQDYSEAVRLYREAVDQGNAKAELFLGIMYANGRGGLAVSLGES